MAVQNQNILDAKQLSVSSESSATLSQNSQIAQSLGSLLDDDLLSQTKLVAAQERCLTARLLAHLREIESKVLSGKLTLTNLAQAQRFFQQEQKIQNKTFSVSAKKEVIEKLEGLSTREAVKELMSLSSEPEMLARPDQIRRLTPQLLKMRFTADQILLDQLEELRGLLAHSNANLSSAS